MGRGTTNPSQTPKVPPRSRKWAEKQAMNNKHHYQIITMLWSIMGIQFDHMDNQPLMYLCLALSLVSLFNMFTAKVLK